MFVSSYMVKCLFGMQSCEQPPSPPSPPQALRQRACICKAKLQSSLGNDLPVPYSRWLEAESTPLPLRSIPMLVRKRWLFLPYICWQLRGARGATLLGEGCHGCVNSSANSHSGLWPEGQIQMPATQAWTERRQHLWLVKHGCAREQHHFPPVQFFGCQGQSEGVRLHSAERF